MSIQGLTTMARLAIWLLCVVHLLLHDAHAQVRATTRISVDSLGDQANGSSSTSSISADGRFVAFISSADNLVPRDTNRTEDVFVHDRQTGETTRVSIDSMGNQAEDFDDSEDTEGFLSASISADGRFVTFSSSSNSLVPETRGIFKVFVHDRETGETTLVSVDSMGNEGNGLFSMGSGISANGRFVTFRSDADNLVPGDTNENDDVFVHDTQTGETARVSVDSMGNESNRGSSLADLSADGRFVAFTSEATNLVPGDTNETNDVFVHDRETGDTTRVSVDSMGNQADNFDFSNSIFSSPFSFTSSQSISADGRFVTFQSNASNLVQGDTNGASDVFVHDRETGETTRVSVDSMGDQASADSFVASISPNGRFVTFTSDAENLVSGDTNGARDLFRHDRTSGETIRVSSDSMGQESNDSSGASSMSADGRVIAFSSLADNLVLGDTNNRQDIFLRDLGRKI